MFMECSKKPNFRLQDFKNFQDFSAKLSHLPKEQRNDLEKLLHTFADIFKDTLGKATLITYHGSKPVAVFSN
jgi:hypothetical protein